MSSWPARDAAQRGYLLTGEDIYLKERDQALSNEMAAADAIKKLTTDNKFQPSRRIPTRKLNGDTRLNHA